MTGHGAAAAAALVLLALPGVAAAAPPLRYLGTGDVVPNGDGVRFMTWGQNQRDGTPELHVLDTVADRRFDTAAPRIYCRRTAVGAARVLWACGLLTPPARPDSVQMPPHYVRDLRTGSLTPVAGTEHVHERFPDGYMPSSVAVGAHWIDARAVPYPVTRERPVRRFFLNWHTGEVRFPTARTDTVDDLNAEGLRVRLCAPLVRRDSGEYRFQFDAPLGLETRPAAPLRLHRCGGRPLMLTTLPLFGFTPPRLSSGLVTWGEQRGPRSADALAYDARSGRTTRWSVWDGQTSSPPAVEHTVDTVFVTVWGNDRPPRFYTAAVR
jgi:hypothetical protein